MQRDIAGEHYWSEEWSGDFDRQGEDERAAGWRNHVTRQIDSLFCKYLPLEGVRDRPLLITEIGCARSRWLPYFARRFGATVSGLDYSVIGCQQAREILAAAGVSGEIVHGDLFAPPAHMAGASDVVFSWGLVEHFEDTENVICALKRFVRPGGLLVTIIPNMAGAIGTVQRWMNERIYRLHVPVDRERLGSAVDDGSGELLLNDYFVSCNFWTVNPGKPPDAREGILPRLAFRALLLVTVTTWLLERTFRLRLPATRRLSPYIVSVWRVGKKPNAVSES